MRRTRANLGRRIDERLRAEEAERAERLAWR
jgi:hypothetical protein